jgi:hypothetical protein
MHKQKITIIAMLVLTISSMFTMFHNAYALTIHDVTQNNTPDSMQYITGLDRYISINAGNVRITNPITYTVQTSYSLTVTADEVACGASVCYVVANGGSNNVQWILGFNPLSGATIYNATFDFSASGGAYSAVNDMVGGTNSMVVSGSNVYAYAICDAGNYVMVVASGSSQAGLIGDCAGTNFGTGTSLSLVSFSNKIAITTDSASVNGFQIWLTSGGRVCQGVSFTAGTAGHLAYSAETDKIYRTSASSQRVDIMNVNTCVDEGDITSAQSGLTTVLRGIEVNDDRDELYIQSTTTVAVMNLTSTSNLLYTFATGGDSSTPRFKTATSEEYVQYATVYDTTMRIVQLDSVEPAPSSTGGIDCNLPQYADILICRLGGTGTLGSAGAFVVGNVSQGTGLLGLGCSMGVVDCTTDDNPQTNGLGLLIFIASIFVIVGMFYRSLGAKQTVSIPVFVWVIIIIALSAFFTITQLIDPVFLILSVLALVALAAPAILKQVRGGSFGGGDSTE